MDFVSKVKETLNESGLSHFGWSPLERPLSIDFYKSWLDRGHHASMDYLVDHLPAKENPQSFAPKARAAIVVAKTYYPHPFPVEGILNTRTALYAHGCDYHVAFKAELEKIAETLRAKFPDDEFLCFTDSSPVLERDLAYRSGLGWIGKNTCAIDAKHGSLFFLGEIFTTLALGADFTAHPDLCGTCSRCIDVCPTGAIEAPRTLNAGKCISYWTIESKEIAPVGLRQKFGDWFFGCDLCQTVCPWNEKVFGRDAMKALSVIEETNAGDALEADLRWILTSSNRAVERGLGKTPYLRARGRGLKRNALYVIGNRRLAGLRAEVEGLLKDGYLGELARWTLEQIDEPIHPQNARALSSGAAAEAASNPI